MGRARPRPPMILSRLPTLIFGFLVLSAVLLAALVIPGAQADRFPGATPERAVPVLWLLVGANFAFAFLLFALSRTAATLANWRWRVVACLAALPILLMGLAMTDGAVAYWGHGAPMRPAAVALFGSAASNVVAGILATLFGLLRPKPPAA